MDTEREPTFEEMISFQFANLVMQTGNMALMFLGKIAHPESGKSVIELDSARMFIDQLEMLSIKTKGNLSPDEQKILGDTLTSLRLMFVETANAQRKGESAKPAAPTPAIASNESTVAPEGMTASTESTDDSRKKFVKKY